MSRPVASLPDVAAALRPRADAALLTRSAHPLADLFPLLDGAELDALVADVRAHGVRDPITLHPDGRILDGRNRYRAAQAAGVACPERTYDGDDPLAYVLSQNLHRRHLTESQRAMMAAKVATMRQGARTDLASIDAKSQRDAGKEFRVSRSGVQRAKEVHEQGTPALVDAVERGQISVARAVHQIRQHAVCERIAAEPSPLPGGRYRVIVADPPWRYECRRDDPTQRRQVPYPDMTVEQIAAVPVAALAAADAVLWLWTTNAHLEHAFGVVRAWGFEPKTILTWAKDRMGVGTWLRGQTEHCVMAVKGRPVVRLTNQSTLLLAPRREHSRKPDEFYAMVESLCPGSKVELFARERRAGWDAWGAEVEPADDARPRSAPVAARRAAAAAARVHP